MSQLSNQLDYKKENFIHPTYRLNKILPLSGSTIATVTTAGGQETIFEIPVNAVNFAKSFMTFLVNVPGTAVADTYTQLFMDVFPYWRQMQLYTRSGIYICDLIEAANYSKVVYNAETKLEDFLNNALMTTLNGAAGAANTNPGVRGAGFHIERNNSANNTLGASRLTGAFAGAGAADISYTEPKYVLRSTGSNATSSMNVCVSVPFSIFKNTIFAEDKDIYFGEIIILRIVWSPSVKIGYINVDAGGTDVVAAPAAYAQNIGISSIALYMAVEKNPEIVNQLRSQISSAGYTLLIPYVYTYKNTLLGTSQNVSLRFNRGHGKSLIKIYHAVFNGTESSATAYDHNNLNGAKCVSYYTMLNNERLQEYDVVAANLDDWNLLKDDLKGSVIQSSNIYQYNWFHRDRFDGLNLTSGEKVSNLNTGLDLSIEQKWDIYCTTTNAQYNHYDFAVTQKTLTISSAGITVI